MQHCKIAVIGVGYVGLVTGACLASLGHKVYCVDVDLAKIKNLQLGKIHIHEPKLSDLILEQINLNNLIFTDHLDTAVANATAIFIAVGTPQAPSGKANLQFVETVSLQIAALLKPNDYKLIIIKSTVPVGTCRQIQAKILQANPDADFDIASNPEFLREGSAVLDFIKPDRIIIGINNYNQVNNKNNQNIKSIIIFNKIYKKFLEQNVPVLFNDLESSELIKYAANCFLAVKLAFVNELADLAENINQNLDSNIDILQVSHAMGLDPRIGAKFLQPGPGFGGSCFPKDTLALDYYATEHNVKLSILNTAISANKFRIHNLSKKINNIIKANNIINNINISILGIAFKANTDDLRDSVAIDVINDLYNQGANLQIYDPEAQEQGKIFFKNLNNIVWCENAYSAVNNADAVIILTEWPEFINLDLIKIKKLIKNPVIIDFRNLFNLSTMHAAGFNYYSVGRKIVENA